MYDDDDDEYDDNDDEYDDNEDFKYYFTWCNDCKSQLK